MHNKKSYAGRRASRAAPALGLVVAVLPGLTTPQRVVGQAFDCTAPFYPGHVLVRFHPTTTAASQQTTHAAAGALQTITEFRHVTHLQLVEVTAGQEQAAVAIYESDPSVDYAEPDYLLHPADSFPLDSFWGWLWGLHNTGQVLNCCLGEGDPFSPYYCATTQLCPDEVSAGPVADIEAVKAWDFWKGRQDFRIAVIDSGAMVDHKDLYLNIWINQGEIPPGVKNNLIDVDSDGVFTFFDLNHPNQAPGLITDYNTNGYIDGGDLRRLVAQGGWADGVDNDENGYVDDFNGWDFADNPPDNNPQDNTGREPPFHGTHVAGTIAARGNNNVGVVGVNWYAQLVILKILPSPSFDPDNPCGRVSNAVRAIEYCIDNHIKVSNNSWINFPNCQSLYNAIKAARDHGHLFVAAAGNSGGDNDTSWTLPASYGSTYTSGGQVIWEGLDNVIAVAASDNNDQWAVLIPVGSNYGANSVHLAAPGQHIKRSI